MVLASMDVVTNPYKVHWTEPPPHRQQRTGSTVPRLIHSAPNRYIKKYLNKEVEGKGCEIQLWTPFKFEVQLRKKKKVGYKAGLGGQSLEGGLGLEKHKGKVLTWAESRTGVSVPMGTAQVRR